MSDANAALFGAILLNRVVDVEAALEAGAEVDAADADRNDITPLMDACDNPLINVEVVEALIKAQATVDARDSFGFTAMHAAAGAGRGDLVTLLVEAGADPDATDDLDGITPLGQACVKGHTSAIKALIAAGVSLSADDGFTPLHSACGEDKIEAAKVLIEAGADVNAVSHRKCSTPLHVAAQWGCHAIVALLLESGADLTLVDSKGETPRDVAVQENQDACVAAIDAHASS